MSDSEGTKASSTAWWTPSAAIEARKLNCKADKAAPWSNIAGTGSPVKTRTRGNRVLLERPPSPDLSYCSPCSGPPHKRLLLEECSTISSITGDSFSAGNAPESTRFIGETGPMIKMMEEFIVCPLCNQKVSVTMTSKGFGIGNVTRLQCTDKTCTFVHVNKPSPANVPLLEDAGSELISRNSDFAVNVLFVLGFIASGDGGTEAARILGLLGLPNATTMQARTFGYIERQLYPVIASIAEDVVRENLLQEVKIYYGETTMPNDNRKQYDVWLEGGIMDESLWPRLTVSADMGWQQRASGKRYNSASGHAFFISEETRSVVCKAYLSKLCYFCKSW